MDEKIKQTNLSINPSHMCEALGGVYATIGIKNTIPLIHGATGCATYTKFLLSHHFKEPIEIATTGIDEIQAIQGGMENLSCAIENIILKNNPDIIAVLTTGLSETMGDDISTISTQLDRGVIESNNTTVVLVSTPSYKGTHITGYDKTITELVKSVIENTKCKSVKKDNSINLIPGIVNPGDVKELKKMFKEMGVEYNLLTDISLVHNLLRTTKNNFEPITIENKRFSHTPIHSECAIENERFSHTPIHSECAIENKRFSHTPIHSECAIENKRFSHTPIHSECAIENIKNSVNLKATISFGNEGRSCAKYLEKSGVKSLNCKFPIGIEQTDDFLSVLSNISKMEVSDLLINERCELVDAIINANDILRGKKIAIFGNPDKVVGLTNLAHEMGLIVVAVLTNTKSNTFINEIEHAFNHRFKNSSIAYNEFENDINTNHTINSKIEIFEEMDLYKLYKFLKDNPIDLLIGDFRGKTIADNLKIPLFRIGFPVVDRIGYYRKSMLGYTGAIDIVENLTNMILDI